MPSTNSSFTTLTTRYSQPSFIASPRVSSTRNGEGELTSGLDRIGRVLDQMILGTLLSPLHHYTTTPSIKTHTRQARNERSSLLFIYSSIQSTPLHLSTDLKILFFSKNSAGNLASFNSPIPSPSKANSSQTPWQCQKHTISTHHFLTQQHSPRSSPAHYAP
jgi:hypothetical protein